MRPQSRWPRHSPAPAADWRANPTRAVPLMILMESIAERDRRDPNEIRHEFVMLGS